MSTDKTSGKERLKEILREEKKTQPIDWEAKMKEWIAQVTILYSAIETWMRDIENVKLERQKTALTEEFIGRYEIDKLLLYFKDATITLNPRGRNIIAARGRIDVQGPNGNKMLLLMGKGERPLITVTITVQGETAQQSPKVEQKITEYEWLIAGKDRKQDLIVLNEDTFSSLVADLIQ